MENSIGIVIIALIAFFLLGYFIAHKRYQKSIVSLNAIKKENDELSKGVQSLQEQIPNLTQQIEKSKADLNKIEKEIGLKKFEFNSLERQTADLKKMEEERQEIESNFANVEDKKQEIEKIKIELDELKSEISLYSELDSFIEYGIYPLPQYGELSSKQYNERLIQIRNEQKGLIKNSKAYIVPEEIEITGNTNYDKQLAQKQGQLLITAFNSQCDYLISKVSTKNYEATMRKIEKVAEQLEKNLLSLEIAIDPNYFALKLKECGVYYSYIYQKEDEILEQREMRAMIREELAEQREIERALREAEKEEERLQQALVIARRELENATLEQKQKYEEKILELEQRLTDAESKEERALSMAQQTRQGHVYIISNIGSFGEDVYKIGMTRRLEPLERIYELGNASVPFAFDVHAMIFSADAPALEKELHVRFSDYSVNKINSRKEFFNVPLDEIRRYLEERGIKTRWAMIPEASQYRQSLAMSEELEMAALL